jgi:hypothetical protein
VVGVDIVVTVKLPVVDPAAIATSVGTNATVPVVHNSTTIPPAGAAVLKVTVPVADAPVATLVGSTATEDRATVADGVTESVAVLLTLL